jgi:hypothetical protein
VNLGAVLRMPQGPRACPGHGDGTGDSQSCSCVARSCVKSDSRIAAICGSTARRRARVARGQGERGSLASTQARTDSASCWSLGVDDEAVPSRASARPDRASPRLKYHNRPSDVFGGRNERQPQKATKTLVLSGEGAGFGSTPSWA